MIKVRLVFYKPYVSGRTFLLSALDICKIIVLFIIFNINQITKTVF
jgi:hypothetical protein